MSAPAVGPLSLGGFELRSRLVLGTGKYPSNAVMAQAHAASGADMVTVAVRRVNLADRSGQSLMDFIDRDRMFILPNTAACYTADEAVRTARLAREAGVTRKALDAAIADYSRRERRFGRTSAQVAAPPPGASRKAA